MLIVNFLIFIQLWSIVFNRLLEDSDTEEKCGNCMYCCMNGSYCGTKSECDRSKIIFASVLGAILGVLILLLIIWFIVTKINKNRKKKALGSYNEEIAKQNELNLSPEREKGQGITYGVAVSTKIPLCTAQVKTDNDNTMDELMDGQRTRAGSQYSTGPSKFLTSEAREDSPGRNTVFSIKFRNNATMQKLKRHALSDPKLLKLVTIKSQREEDSDRLPAAPMPIKIPQSSFGRTAKNNHIKEEQKQENGKIMVKPKVEQREDFKGHTSLELNKKTSKNPLIEEKHILDANHVRKGIEELSLSKIRKRSMNNKAEPCTQENTPFPKRIPLNQDSPLRNNHSPPQTQTHSFTRQSLQHLQNPKSSKPYQPIYVSPNNNSNH